MALTYVELEQWIASNAPRLTFSLFFTLVRTQGDRRVGYMNPEWIQASLQPDRSIRLNQKTYESFSDRERDVNVSGVIVKQPFDAAEASTDETSLIFQPAGADEILMTITFARWNPMPIPVPLRLNQFAKVYLGLGPPVGANTTDPAVYMLTFNRIAGEIH